jgi:hypothetical protein
MKEALDSLDVCQVFLVTYVTRFLPPLAIMALVSFCAGKAAHLDVATCRKMRRRAP